jgi:hypothetical protein
MPPPPDRQLARLQARYQKQAAELAHLGFMLKGSVLQRFLPCGNPGCRCHADPPRLHGPYWQWTSKVAGKTVTRMLNPQQARRYRTWIANGKRFKTIVQKLHHIADQADAILRVQERKSPDTGAAHG